MPLPSPNLDDRTFADLVEEGRRRLIATCPNWTDLSPSDPGMALLELFAYLTEIMIYRLNRIPDKAYVEFLRLIGVRLQPPGAAAAELRFTRVRGAEAPIQIARGTRVTLARSDGGAETPVFVTSRAITIPAGAAAAEVTAHHCELIEAELAAKGTGLPGLSIAAARPPIIARSGDELDLLVGVETVRGELDERAPAVQWEGKAYRIWREADSFGNLADPYAYVVDRISGVITFAPAARMRGEAGELEAARALAAVPAAGREIRLWYRRGGGPSGNVAANSLTVLKDPVAGVEVTNPGPASGGRAAETLDNALIRGPQEMHSLQRAVTARDFEMLALRSSGAVARAKAFTKAGLWVHAPPGTVEVLLVPYLPEAEQDPARANSDALREHRTEEVRAAIESALEERKPLGTTCLVNWARVKSAQVTARVVARREENPAALQTRVLQRLYQSINPLPSGGYSGWRFGQALRAFNVYDIVVAEPGVSYVDQVKLLVQEVPEKEVRCIAADFFQPRTWYAGSEATLFRSLNDGDGWEAAGRFPDTTVQSVCVHPDKPGLLAVSTRLNRDEGGARVHVSCDCGETWTVATETAFDVEQIAWITREGVPALLLATGVGLYELSMRPGAPPVQIAVEARANQRGFYSVAVSIDVRGALSVAAAAQSTGGVFLSTEGGKPGTFRSLGLSGEDVRVLAVQHDGPISYLWAGLAAGGGDDPGKGCYRWELKGSADSPDGWKKYQKNWDGGSCRGMAFLGPVVLAASHHRGVLRVDARKGDAGWDRPEVGSGLPLREAERLFQRVDAVAVDPGERLLFAAGPAGVYRSGDAGVKYEVSSTKVFLDKVTLPETWLFCSGAHEIAVVSEDDAGRS